MTIKLGRMVTYYNLGLPTQLCDLLIYWSRDIQSAKVFKGAFPENLNTFETN